MYKENSIFRGIIFIQIINLNYGKKQLMNKFITIRSANENNLKNISLKIPKNKLVVFTGLSGSGKTSLAFDTIYAEGQRRYIESLSAYARQFLGQMNKPNVEYIEGLSPAISIDQKTTNRNPRSTVGTVTEIYDYLRLLYARIGFAHCPQCGTRITSQSIDMIINDIMELKDGEAFYIISPVVTAQKGQHKKTIDDLKKSGYARVIVDKEMYDINDVPELDKNIKTHNRSCC
jgi:excinuclease ABC subunit A